MVTTLKLYMYCTNFNYGDRDGIVDWLYIEEKVIIVEKLYNRHRCNDGIRGC